MTSSSPYRCCGDSEDALFTQSLSCNHMLDALFTMHNCTYMQTNKSQMQIIKNMQYAFFTMHTKPMHMHTMTNKSQVHVHKHATCIMQNIHNHKQITHLHVDISLHTVCALFTQTCTTQTQPMHCNHTCIDTYTLTRTFTEFRTVCRSAMGEQTPVCCCQEEPDAF